LQEIEEERRGGWCCLQGRRRPCDVQAALQTLERWAGVAI